MADEIKPETKQDAVPSQPIRHDLAELQQIIREATATVEDELAIEDQGWIKGGTLAADIITELARTDAVKLSRLYYTKDPLAKQAIRLWTDYTFGNGMTWSTDDNRARKALEDYWNNPDNQSVLSARGQRRSSDKALVEGEVYFALFLGPKVTVRIIDPLEITEIITDPDDRDNERYYKREWRDAQAKSHTDYYCSHRNPKNQACQDYFGKSVQATTAAKNVVVYRLPFNTIGQRGMPLLLPALDWIKQYRRFLASRVAIMLALARFAWKTKVQGGATAVAGAKTKLEGVEVPAGSVMVENMGADTQPIRTDSNARNAYDDGRMLKLQVAAAVGIPEQYFGDISIGNLATAKTVELPMMKMFQSYQTIWRDAFKDMDEIVLEKAGVDKDIPITRNFPAIAPEDAVAAATALAQVLTVMPNLADIDDVIQLALVSLGVTNAAEVLEKLHDNDLDRDFSDTNYSVITDVGKNGESAENIASGEKLNGIQIRAAMEVLWAFINKNVPEEVAVELLVAVGIDRTRAQEMVNSCKRFEPANPGTPLTSNRQEANRTRGNLKRIVTSKPGPPVDKAAEANRRLSRALKIIREALSQKEKLKEAK